MCLESLEGTEPHQSNQGELPQADKGQSSSTAFEPSDRSPSSSVVCFLFFFFLFSCPQFSACCVRPLDAVLLFCFSSHPLFPLPPPPVCLPLTLSLSILASDIIYIGPVKGKPLLFSPLSVLHFSALLPHRRPHSSSLPSPPPLLYCPLPARPSFLPPAAGVSRSHDICNLWDSWAPSHLTASYPPEEVSRPGWSHDRSCC